MGGHAGLGMVVHGLGAHLYFNRLTCGIPHHGVQRLVAIGFGPGDVVVKLVGHRIEMIMHPAQRGVAVWHGGHHDAQRPDVVHLVKPQRFAAHLFNDTVNVFGAALHCGVYALLA